MSNLAYVLAGAGVLIAVVVIYGLAQRQRGRAEAGKKSAEKAVTHARKAREAREDVARMSDSDLADELYDDQ